MIVFWRGWGPISAVLPVGGLILAEIGARIATPDGNIWWRGPLAVLLAGVLSLVVFLLLRKSTDPETRKSDPLLFSHHLMFIPMGLHPLVFFLIGAFQWMSAMQPTS